MRVWRALGSSRLAAVLIAVLLGLAIVSVVVPQTLISGTRAIAAWRASDPWIAGPAIALGLDRVFVSWPYWAVSALLALNLVVCTLERIRKRRGGGTSLGEAPEGARAVRFDGDAHAAAAVLGRRLAGWEVREADGGAVCRSGRWGFAGSVAMHTGLVLIILATVLTGLTRFEGQIVLTEGMPTTDVRDAHLQVTAVPRLGAAYTGATLTLDRMEFDYSGPVITDARARVRVREDGRERDATVRVNHPLRVGAKSFLLKDSGYAVALEVTDASGTLMPPTVVNLGRARPDGYEDSLTAGRLKLDVLAVPDAAAPRGVAIAHKLVPVDPAVVLTVREGTRVVVRDALVRPGGSVRAGDLRVGVLDVRRWTRFNARVDQGIYLAYLAFALIVAGSTVRVLDPDRVVRVRVAEDGAQVWARAPWGRELASASADRVIAALESAAGDESRERTT